MPVSYISASTVKRAGINVSSLARFIGHLSADVAAGGTSLTLNDHSEGLPTDLAVNDVITLFDGLQSEQVRATSVLSGSTVSVTALQYAHSAHVEYCLDGKGGASLGDMLFRAAGKLENYCRQSLLQQSYEEKIRLRMDKVMMRRDGGLKILPDFYPIQSLTSISIQYDGPFDPLVIDPTLFDIDHTRDRLFLPYQKLLESLVLWIDDPSELSGYWSRGSRATVVYVAGFPFDRLPGDLQEAVLLLLRSNLSKLQNPAGAVSVKMGERQVVYRSNNALYDNQLEAEACQLLDNGYVRKSHRRA